ncbi:MAG: IS1595 family transposase, partial [Patescibacteria group bacterium]
MTPNRKTGFKPLSLLDFQRRFATEEDCAAYLFKKRWPEGWHCPRCGRVKCYYLKTRRLYECASCGRQVSVTAGTVMHNTRTPLCLWFMAIYLMTSDKRGISSVGLGRQLGISQKRAWTMLHKLRRAMGVRDGRYRLDGLVELDEDFLGAPGEGGCRGGGEAKKRVLIGLSLDGDGKPRHLRLKVLPCNDGEHLGRAVREMVAPGAVVRTNGRRVYLRLGREGYRHVRVPAKESGVPEDMRWLRVAATNIKALIGGTHHGLGRSDGKHLQAYLDEFAYRFNRRRAADIFGR